MSTENTPVDPTDDLDAFSADFFGQNEAQPEPASSEDTEDAPDEESDALNNDATHEGDETPDDTDSEDDEADEPAPKPKKNRAAERIEELNKKYRETQRELEELKSRLEKNDSPATKQNEVVESAAPQPTDQNEDGTDKYPLGEFDPLYIRDLTRFELAEGQKALDAERQKALEEAKVADARVELETEWNSKLGPAKERYPDFDEKGQELFEAFADVDQDYGEYLASTLMQMEYGPDVLYYLANHPDEARKIVDSGPFKATLAFGRIESKFAFADEEKQKARPKVSQAPTPPVHTNRGNAAPVPEIPADTDDLDSFEKVFFKKK